MDKQPEVLDGLKITTIVEDSAGFDRGLRAEHGVSFLVEATSGDNSVRLLFDTGQSAEVLLHNMHKLGLDPKSIDLVVLSHCHYDHTGGLLGFLKEAQVTRLPVVAHPAVFRASFSADPKLRTHGVWPAINKEAIKSLGGDLILTKDPLKLFPGIITSGEIKDLSDFEQDPTLSSYTLEEGKLKKDLFEDDLSLFIKIPQGLVVLSGCSHPGIVSIVRQGQKITGLKELAAVIGGFHLISADEERINKTAAWFAASKNLKVYTGHCTGFKALEVLSGKLRNRFFKLHTGLSINF